MNQKTSFLIGAVIIIFLITIAAIVASGDRLAARLGAIARQGAAEGDAIVAEVNGEKIMLSWVEAVRVAAQAGAVSLSDPEAYEEALKSQIHQKLLLQEAVRRGILVTDEAVQKYMTRQQELAANDPQIEQIEKSYWAARGDVSEETRFESVRKLLLLNEIQRQLYEEAAEPAEMEIEQYLAANPVRSVIQLLAADFGEEAQAMQVFDGLRAMDGTKEDLFSAFLDQARTRKARAVAVNSDVIAQPASAFVGADVPDDVRQLLQTFEFSHTDELPEYVQTAYLIKDNPIGAFVISAEHAVVYLRLSIFEPDVQQAESELRAEFVQQKRDAYVSDYIGRLFSEAEIEIFYENLPVAISPVTL